TRLDQIAQQPAARPAPASARHGAIGRAIPLGRGAGSSAFAPLAALALKSTAMSGAAVRRAALARVPEGRRSLSDLGRAMDALGVRWDGRLLVVAVELESGRRAIFGLPEETSV